MLGKIIRREMGESKEPPQKVGVQTEEIPARDAKIKDLSDSGWLDPSNDRARNEMRDQAASSNEIPPFSIKDIPGDINVLGQVEDSLSLLEKEEENYKEFEAKRKQIAELLRETGDLVRAKKDFVLTPDIVNLGKDIISGISRLRMSYLRSVFQYETEKYMEGLLIEHTINVALLSIVIGFEMGYDEEDLFHIFMAGIFHDIGVFRIGPKILNKPSALNLHEKRVMSVHPVEGSKLFEEALRSNNGLISDPDLLVKLISQEHERADGSGYPYKLKEGELHPFAMILGISDTFESLTHPRPYRERLLPFRAFRKLFMNKEERCLFTRGIRKACFAGITPYPPGTSVNLNTGDRAVVLEVDPWWPLNPVIVIRQVGKDSMIVHHRVIDLRKNNLIHVNHNEARHSA